MSAPQQTEPGRRFALELRANFGDTVDVKPIADAMKEATTAVLERFGFKGPMNVYVHEFTVAAPCDPVDATNEKMTTYHLLVAVDRRWGSDVHGNAKCGTAFVASIFGPASHGKKRCPKCYDENAENKS
jgi:hypothetical protein